MATATTTGDLRKGAKVVARVDMRDVPAGTAGKVSMVTGLSWIRYWVRFENGVSLGTIHRKRLATPEEWERYLAGDEEVEAFESDDESDGEVAAEADTGGGGGGATTSNGTFVSQKHIDRAKAARERLGG